MAATQSPLATIRYWAAARLLGLPGEAKANPIGALISSMWSGGSPVYTPRSFEALAREGFQNNGYVFRAISIIAQACAGIPWLLYQQKGKRTTADDEKLEQHPLLDLLAHPHGLDNITGTASLIEQIVSYYVLSGNSYLTALRPTTRKGPPVELWVQQPGRMRILPAADGTVATYRYTVSGKSYDFDPADVLHWKSFSPLDDWYGLSPVGVAARIVDQMNSANDWNTALMQNMARPSGFLTSPTQLSDPQFERLQAELKAKYASAKNAGKPGLLEGGMTWQQVGMAPTDLDWLEGKKTNVREIAVVLGVPSELLGDSTNKTYSNYGEARKSFYTETVLPLMDVLRDLFNAWLVPMYADPSLHLDYDRDDIEALQEDRALVWTRAQTSYAGGLLTLNEARDLLGYDALDDGDVVLAPPRGITLDQLLSGASLPKPPSSEGIPALPPKTPPDDSQGLPPAPQQAPSGQPQPGLPEGKIVDADRVFKSWAQKAKAASVHEQREKWRTELTAQARAQFQDEQSHLESILDDDDTDPDQRITDARAYVASQAAVWAALLATAYAEIGKAAGNDLYSQWRADGLIPDDASFTVSSSDDLDSLLNDKADGIATYSGDRLHSVLTDALKDATEGAIGAALVGGLASLYDQWTGDDDTGSRADVIGTTESTTAWGAAQNGAALAAIDQYGVGLTQTWNAVLDNRTWDWHADADGQTVNVGDTFDVGGEAMAYPCDPAGSPDNTVNCRCFITFDGTPLTAA